MAFFNSAVGVLQTLVIALGAGLGIWGAINRHEAADGWRRCRSDRRRTGASAFRSLRLTGKGGASPWERY